MNFKNKTTKVKLSIVRGKNKNLKWNCMDSSHSQSMNKQIKKKCLYFPCYYTMFAFEFNMKCAVNRLRTRNETGTGRAIWKEKLMFY